MQAPARSEELVLYTRPECCLCEVAKDRLREMQDAGWRFEVVERDVDEDPDARAAYGEEVPVGELAGRKVFKYRVDVARLEAALRARGLRR
jgi:hypothetical protein